VKKFYEEAISAGGKDNGAPGIREHIHPNYYAAVSDFKLHWGMMLIGCSSYMTLLATMWRFAATLQSRAPYSTVAHRINGGGTT